MNDDLPLPSHQDTLYNQSRKIETQGDYIEGNQIIYLQTDISRGLGQERKQDLTLAIPAPPGLLVGRTQLLANIREDLHARQHVSLTGMGGVGKTSVAASIAEEYQRRGEGIYWLRVGHLDIESLCNEFGRHFSDQTIVCVDLENKLEKICALLHTHQIKLVILDDVWNEIAARTFIRGILPISTTLLITSRKRISVGRLYNVGFLKAPDDADLFRYHARFDKDMNVDGVCQLLKGHPLALEIAGKYAWINALTSNDLVLRLQEAGERVHTLALSDDAHENMWATLQNSYKSLSEQEQMVFRAFGSLWVNSATPEILTAITQIDPNSTQYILDNLVRNSLIQPELTLDGIKIYRLHDLVYDFAGTIAQQINNVAKERAFQALAEYSRKHAQQKRVAHDYLEAERENLFYSAEWCKIHERWGELNSLALDLYEKSEFLRWRGYLAQSIQLLTLGALAAEKLDNRRDLGTHFTNLGITYRQLGQIEKGIEYHKRSLEIMREIGDVQGESDSLGEIGWAYNRLGQVDEAVKCLRQAYETCCDLKNQRWEAIWLATLGRVYTDIGQVPEAIKCHTEALGIMQEIGDERGQGARFGELGWDYMAIGDYNKALEYFQTALEFALKIEDRRREGAWLAGIAEAHLDLKSFDKASEMLHRALAMAQSVGDSNNEAEILHNVAKLYLYEENFENCEKCLTRALGIFREANHQRGIGNCLHTFGELTMAKARRTQGLKVVSLVKSAMSFYKQALEIRKRMKDPRVQDTSNKLSRLKKETT